MLGVSPGQVQSRRWPLPAERGLRFMHGRVWDARRPQLRHLPPWTPRIRKAIRRVGDLTCMIRDPHMAVTPGERPRRLDSPELPHNAEYELAAQGEPAEAGGSG